MKPRPLRPHPFGEWIEPYVTGDLSARRRARMDAHLDGCESCRDAIALLRSIRSEAGRLDRAIEPEGDLWPAIAAALEPRSAVNAAGSRDAANRAGSRDAANRAGSRAAASRDQPRRHLIAYAAAAIAVLAIASTLWWGGPGGSGAPTGQVAEHGDRRAAAPRLEGALAAFGATESVYQEAASILEDSYAAGASDLRPATVAAIDRNLRILDAAIGEVRVAVESRPDDPGAVELLADRYRHKVDVLRRLSRISASTPVAEPVGVGRLE